MTDAAIIIGRAEIAFRLGVSEKTVSRWIKRGILPATHSGPARTCLLQVQRSELERLKAIFAGQEEAA